MSLAKGHPTALVMLDLSAALGTIDHTTLLAACIAGLASVEQFSTGFSHISQIVPKWWK
jgi:hypothetical protein